MPRPPAPFDRSIALACQAATLRAYVLELRCCGGWGDDAPPAADLPGRLACGAIPGGYRGAARLSAMRFGPGWCGVAWGRADAARGVWRAAGMAVGAGPGCWI